MGIGKRIREARLKQHMTQQELGKLLGVTKGAVANYENDVSHPKETVLYQLFHTLSVDANYLFQDMLPANTPVDFSSGRKDFSSGHAADPLLSSLTLRERKHLQDYRLLSNYSRDTIDYLTERERGTFDHSCRTADIETEIIDPAIAPAASEFPAASNILKIYPYLNMTASAGFSTYSEDIPQERVQAPACRNADFIIGVSGDSMMPLYQNGDLLYVERTDRISEGEIGIFSKNGEMYVKKAGKDRLISLNPEYPDITADGSYISAVGRVLGQVDSERITPVD